MVETQSPWYAGEVFYGAGSPAIYSFQGVNGLSEKNGVVSKYKPKIIDPTLNYKWSIWGDDNLFPENVDTDVRKNAIATTALELLIRVHFGKGIYPYKETTTPEGKVIKTVVNDPEINKFFRQSNFNRFLIQSINDYVWFRNIFPELIFSKDGKKIAAIKRHDPIHCRWSISDERGNIPNLFISTKWPAPADDQYITIPSLDVDFPLIDILNRREQGKIKGGDSVIMPVRLNTGGNLYYDETPWDAIRSQWLPIATNVPKMKKALLENQMTIKYHIKVPYSFWERKFGNDWNGWTKEVQETKITEWREKMDKFLRGVENTGKSFVSFYDRDEYGGKIFDEIIIEAIDDKMGDKKWLTDSQAANSENLFGLGVDPTILGQSSPGGSEGGSGSNKREAFYIMQALMGIPRNMVMWPLELIRDFNGWDPEIKFGHVDVDTSQTLDQNPTGKQTTMS